MTFSPLEVRTAIDYSAVRKSTGLGLALFTVSASFYIGGFILLLQSHFWFVKAALSLLLGFIVPVLFVIGHDACHGSLTRRPKLNQILGRLAFLPSLHPYTGWEWTHNVKHHGFTNVRGEDIVYVPFAPDEFASLPPWRRVAERLYRSPFGLGALYFCTVYWPFELFPAPQYVPPAKRRKPYQIDRALVLCFLAAQVLLLSLWGHPSVAKAALNLFFGIIVPQAGFHWLMGFVTFMHHTHPKIPWYANRREYSYYRSQVCSTTHIEFPPLLDFVLHRILQHTAHHVDPTIPLYHLLGAQEGLEKRFQEIIHEPFTLRGFLLTLRTCRLYDYQSHRWLDFNGVPTSDTVFAEEAALEGTA